jgi:hypothetical protein
VISPIFGRITDDSAVVKFYEDPKKIYRIEVGWFHGSILRQLYHIFINEIQEFMKNLNSN